MSRQRVILRMAVPAPLFTTFDYLPPAGCPIQGLQPGMRFKVPFGRRHDVGLLLEVAASSAVASGKLKQAEEKIDDEPLLGPDSLALMQWAAEYYHHPIGEVMAAMLPAWLRVGRQALEQEDPSYRLTAAGSELDIAVLRRAPRQAALLQFLRGHDARGMRAEDLNECMESWREPLRALLAKGWLETAFPGETPWVTASSVRPRLNDGQRQAVEAVTNELNRFQAHVLDGVTGSGKTEVYLHIIEQVVAQGRQALVLVPEIGLTPQLVDRFRQRFAVPLAVMHSGLADRERLNAWVRAHAGRAGIVIGTRSAVFTPLLKPGVIILDEEHDASFKQHEGFRYHARDVAVWRAHRAGIPVVLGSATPSLESLYNVQRRRYRHLILSERAGTASHPAFRVVDVRNQKLEDNLSTPLLKAMAAHLQAGQQVLLFLNRRGYAPTLFCHSCGWVADCRRCDAHMTLHQGRRRLCCHHCGAERPPDDRCPACGSEDLRALGQGTERIEQALAHHFPGYKIARIDRDSTRRKGALEAMLNEAHKGESRILVGTQMLAKGHHLPQVTLVGIVDVDQGLYSADFRGPERMAQLIVQVAGRAGRADAPGEVLIQTHLPQHPLLHTLITGGYAVFAQEALRERQEAGLPPYAYIALLRAEATAQGTAMGFLQQARQCAAPLGAGAVEWYGPAQSPMERRAGHYRAQLLLQSTQRADLHRVLQAWLPKLGELPLARKVRWSMDVDPMEMF